MGSKELTKATKSNIESFFKELQDSICSNLETLDGVARFQEDSWVREEGGGGRSRIIQNGKVFEKGGVNFSAVYGNTPKKITDALGLPESDFYATGVSIVIHPQNPWVPIIHMNVRYFEMNNGIWWFGGGIDLTPHYIIKEDAAFFHNGLKGCCDKHHHSYYDRFKKWADDYFFIKHREETRGIGGIFFDRLNDTEQIDKDALFAFVKEVGNTFFPLYQEVVNRNKNKTFEEKHKNWQYLRRGRYVEFNLVYDKGTKFGLDTNGRTESILMSLPPQASWTYNYQASKDSLEEYTLNQLKKGISWI